MRALPAAAVLALSLSLTACGGDDKSSTDKAAEKLIESQEGVNEAEVDEDGYKVETDEGTISAGKGTEFPDGFPSDVPLPSAEYEVLSAVEQEGEFAVMLTITGEFDFDAEKADMESALTDAGYEIIQQARGNSEGVESFSIIAQGNDQQVAITAAGEFGEVTAMYTVSPVTD